MTIGERIKKIRMARGISTYTLAQITGLSQSSISKLENGKRKADNIILEKIADVLNVSIDRLTGDSVSNIIESRLKEVGKTLEAVAKEANVPLIWLQNIDSFIPGNMEFMLTQPRELDWDDTIGDYTSYEWITRVADVLGLPGGVLRTALARQEIPVPDDLPQITAAEAFGGANAYKPQGADEPEPLSTSEKDHINKYRELDTHGKEMVDFTLLKEWERSTALAKEKSNVTPMTVKQDTPDYLKPQAAHNDHINEEGELEKIQEDLAMLDAYKKNH